MVKEPFERFTIAVTGDFGRQRTLDKMRQWIQVNGGTFSYDMSPNVTHLICSKDHFKENATMVQQARKLETVKIVSFDWLEDSLLQRTARSEREYLMGPRARDAAKTKAKKKSIRRKNIGKAIETFEKACKEFEGDMFSNGYGIYQDSTRFNYDITLVRADLCANKNERYVLRLHISHATPKIYCCNVKYSSPGSVPNHEVLAPIGSTWETAWRAFEMFFKSKTKKDWDMRFLKCDLGTDVFMYTPPREGEPRGLFLEA